MGGICEDGMGAIMTGISAYGRHVGVASSYAAFIAAMQHTAARLYGIASSARKSLAGDPYRPYIMVCGHAGYKTGEDGPSHADPQALQLLQGNFPSDICITLTPWDPQEIWALVTAALQARPAVISVFVTRPTEVVIDRKAKGLSPASETAKGVYAMRRADPSRTCQGTLVLQESGVTYAFVEQTLPKLDADGINLNIYYISSAELFDRLTEDEQERIFPLAHRREAMAITGFTMPTMYRWVLSEAGRNCSLHAFTCGKYPGSGQAYQVLIEAHLDGESQYQAIKGYIARLARVR
jgi:transketolase